ncbi:MAG: hypothetical protein CUN56_02820 [Phototrophicales bacterium]|nr:MAG: hypothetical protein CUN56_02820 [Phototrophicales bacterium]RMG71194.1 MAG: DegV family protein [Chloroflexota bacterium]
MTTIHIVTDSSACFVNPADATRVTIVPHVLELGGQTYREGIDISAEDAHQIMGKQTTAPRLFPPSVKDYVAVYSKLAQHYDAIISIHTSREILTSWQNARAAAQQVGHSKILVFDSQTICASQGMLISAALQQADDGVDPDEIIWRLRGITERIYAMYYVESVGYLHQNRIMSPAHAILGNLLGIKPFLAVEEGRLRLVEKVRSRIQAIERLVEFVIEFTEIEQAVILQPRHTITEQTRLLQERLAVEFPGMTFDYGVYHASLGALIGADATGVVILEKPSDYLGGSYDDED